MWNVKWGVPWNEWVSLKCRLLWTGFRMSGCECWRCWLGNEWAEVKTGSGPCERVTELDGGGFYQLCALWCLLSRLPFAACLSVGLRFTALRWSSLAASVLPVGPERIFLGAKWFGKGSDVREVVAPTLTWPAWVFAQITWRWCPSISDRTVQHSGAMLGILTLTNTGEHWRN